MAVAPALARPYDSRMIRFPRWTLGCALALASPAAAQTVEVTPLGGFRLGGSFQVEDEPAELEVKESGAWGLSVTVNVSEEGEIEALFARQSTRLDADGLFASDPRFDLALDVYQLGGNYLFGEDRQKLRPYIGAALGVTRLDPEPAGLSSETRFSASLAGGLKAYLGAHVGLRFEVRGFFTVLESDSRVFCGSLDGCNARTSGSDLSQAEIRGGLLFRF